MDQSNGTDPRCLFTYGTLQPGFENAFAALLRARAEWLGRGWFAGALYDLGAYPGAVYDETCSGRVHGSVYLLDGADDLLELLDAYEGVGIRFEQPNEYVRREIPVRRGAAVLTCWAYLYNRPVAGVKRIASGAYLPNGHRRFSGKEL